MASTIDTEKIGDILRDCAERHIVPRFRALEEHEVRSKTSPQDLVTIADTEAEEALDIILTREFPGSVVIGEEGISSGAKQISALHEASGVIWVVDPVDGTNNFVRGQDEFCTMLACVIDGRTRYGWIYDIPGKRMMFAEQGAGAHLDGIPCRPAGSKPLKDCVGFAGRGYFAKQLRPVLDSFKGNVKNLYSLGCAGHEYLRFLTGQVDFGLYTRIRPWDHLVGSLAAQEAGGIVKKWDGSPYAVKDYNCGIAVASHAGLMQELDQAVIAPLFDEYSRMMAE